MFEGASLLSFYLAFALLCGADPRRFPAPSWKPTEGWLRAMRLGAVAAVIAGVALWTRVGGVAAALLMAPTALSVAATVFVLLAPLAGRMLWGVALACPLLIAILALAGGSNG